MGSIAKIQEDGQVFPLESLSEDAPNPLFSDVSGTSSKAPRGLQGEYKNNEAEREKLPPEARLSALVEGAPQASSFRLNKLGLLDKRTGKFTDKEVSYWRDRISKGTVSPDDLSNPMLKTVCRLEWNSYKAMRYDRCGENGTNECHANLSTFPLFLKEKSLNPKEGYTLHRVDNCNPEYSAENAEWASRKRQTWERSNTRLLMDNTGECVPAEEWANRKGIPSKLILQRIDRDGWPEHDAIHTPKGQKRVMAKGSHHYTTSSPLVSVWKEALKDTPDCQFWSFTAAEKKMLKDWGNRINEGGLKATEVLPFVLKHWKQFTQRVEWDYAIKSDFPRVPTLEFLVKYCTASGNFFINEPERMAKPFGKDFGKSWD